jgi:hypothetical protein
VTVTGLQVVSPATDFTPFGQGYDVLRRTEEIRRSQVEKEWET